MTSMVCTKYTERLGSMRPGAMETWFSWAQDRNRGVWAESDLLPAGCGLPESFPLVLLIVNRCASPLTRFQQNSQNRTSLCSHYAPDDDGVEEFYVELESTLIVKFTTVVMGDFSAKLGDGEKAEKRCIDR